MKKLLLSISFIFAISGLSAQQWATNGNDIYNTNSGNVGIGISSSLSAKLHIYTTSQAPGITLQANYSPNGASWGAGFWLQNLYPGAGGNIYGIYANELGQLIVGNEFTHQSTISILPNGQMGIGTSVNNNLGSRLQVHTTDALPGIIMQANTSNGMGFGAGFQVKNLYPGAGGNFYGIYENEYGQLIIGNELTHQTTITILPTGQMGIGTGLSNLGSFKLAVEGKIGAREVHVTNTNPWPDFVFKPTYQLLPLYEVEKYVKQNNHLPGVPSTCDVKDGIDIGKMNAVLLQKIEELTLYIIELNKKIEILEGKSF